jgi:hypothetical protein
LTKEQADAFEEIIRILHVETILPYVVIIGSWAEYLYEQTKYFDTNFKSNLRTRDVDVLYGNIKKPGYKTNVTRALVECGFIYHQDVVSGIGKFSKGEFIDLEFLTKVLGSGKEHIYEIPSVGIKAEGFRTLNLLADNSVAVDFHSFSINVPEPSAYVLHKLIINPDREPDYKKEKDINAVRELLTHIKKSDFDKERLCLLYEGLSTKNRRTVEKICKEHWLEIP